MLRLGLLIPIQRPEPGRSRKWREDLGIPEAVNIVESFLPALAAGWRHEREVDRAFQTNRLVFETPKFANRDFQSERSSALPLLPKVNFARPSGSPRRFHQYPVSYDSPVGWNTLQLYGNPDIHGPGLVNHVVIRAATAIEGNVHRLRIDPLL